MFSSISCHAVAVQKGKLIVGHLPKEISKVCWFFIHRGGTIKCIVKDKRRISPIEQAGLEVPCELIFTAVEILDGNNLMSKLKKMFK